MAAMTTVLTEFSNSENTRKSTLTGHTAVKPQMVIEKRRVAEGNQIMVEQSFKIVKGTEDVDGIVLPNKVTFEVIARYPISGTMADVTAGIATLADICAGDEFANSVATQEWM